MTNKLKWGVMSCADIGLRAMVPAIQRAKNGVVVAIASRDLRRAQQAAIQHDISRAYGDYRAILTDPEVDAVYIPLPNSMHAEWTIQAVQNGKHVLCEKPLALSSNEVDAIAETAAAREVLVMEALMYRLHPQTDRIVDIIRSGSLGAVQLVTASFTYNVPNPDDIRLKQDLGGGVLQDVGTYCVSVARLAMGVEPVEVQGRARIGPASDVDELFTGLLRFPNGSMATFGCSLHGPREQWYKVTGSEASLTVPVPFAPGVEDRHLIIRRGWQRGKETEEQISVAGADQYQLLVEHFVDCILAGDSPLITLNETRANVAAVSALRQSALTGNSIHI